MTVSNTLFLRLEGPLQAWGDPSKLVIRRTMEAPTKSGVLGLLCCALGLTRAAARQRLPELNRLAMGVRMDRPGVRWWDYHTVGAGIGLATAAGGVRTGAKGTLVTRREYLADASFLVALQGEAELVEQLAAAIAQPRWPVFLGRKSCPPSAPVFARPDAGESWTNPGRYDGLTAALCAVPWHPWHENDPPPANGTVETLEEWRPASSDDVAPDDAEVWYDVPVSFDPPAHEPRFVLRATAALTIGQPSGRAVPPPPRPRADYGNRDYRTRREQRLKADAGLCVFCKLPGPGLTVQHVTYRRAGGNETLDDLRSLCRLCHDAITMIEYGLVMGVDRINPEDPRWRQQILEKRAAILQFRSLKTRRRLLRGHQVE